MTGFARTRLFLRQARLLGLVGVSGLYMLAAQAIAAEKFFLDATWSASALADRTGKVYHALRSRTENLVLIGMPAVGKTTVGKLLAEKTGREFYDTDTELEKRIGSIPEYIRQHGEQAFRERETEALQELCAKTRGAVIATGGGIVLREENVRTRGENGVQFWLHREIDGAILSGSRPLSSDPEQWKKLYQVRKPYYQKASDFCVFGQQNPEEAVETIIKEYQTW